MPTIKALLTSLFIGAASAAGNITPGVEHACSDLSHKYNKSVVFPSDPSYVNESTAYWDVRSDLQLACIFLPEDANQVSQALKIFSKRQTQFAIRGGGHMSNPGSNNIDNGVVLVLTKLDKIKVHPKELTYEASPGNRWVDVYEALAPHGLYSLGGRLKTIGVPGLSLIGGFHYSNNKYGFVMDQVLKYDVVLANGTQVVASKISHPELFWGLKGQSNNLGIVTKFTFRALQMPKISTTIQSFNESEIDDFFTAVDNLVKYQDGRVAAGQLLTVQYNATTKHVEAQLIGVQEGTQSPPSTFANFTAIPSESKIHNVSRPADFHSLLDSPNQMFRVQQVHGTMIPDVEQIKWIFRTWKAAVDDIDDVKGLYPTLVFNTIPKIAQAVAKNNGIGNIWGLPAKESLLIWQFSTAWAQAEDDIRITNWLRQTFDFIESLNREKKLARDFLYMGDISEIQDPFASFPLENVQRLRKIRDAYDPERIFVSLNWGGFKIVRNQDKPAVELTSHKDLSAYSRFTRASYSELMTLFARTVAERTRPGQRQDVEEHDLTSHALGSSEGICGMVDDFLTKYPRSTWADGAQVLACPELKEYLSKYQDPHQADSILKIQKELDETKIVIHKTIESVLQRGEKLDDLVAKSDGLSAQSKLFYQQAKQQNSCCVVM
ncbi:Ff.00g040520.m01.CDS01 [Fusarium sp. VM40]|nr:Ff.00g040520.m01.CDS01 [Fusarium sp. VM40]